MPGAGSGPASPEDYSVAGNVSEDVVNDIAQWIKATRRPGRRSKHKNNFLRFFKINGLGGNCL